VPRLLPWLGGVAVWRFSSSTAVQEGSGVAGVQAVLRAGSLAAGPSLLAAAERRWGGGVHGPQRGRRTWEEASRLRAPAVPGGRARLGRAAPRPRPALPAGRRATGLAVRRPRLSGRRAAQVWWWPCASSCNLDRRSIPLVLLQQLAAAAGSCRFLLGSKAPVMPLMRLLASDAWRSSGQLRSDAWTARPGARLAELIALR